MDYDSIKLIIKECLQLYWKSYGEIENNIAKAIKTKFNIKCDQVICMGDVTNFYVFIILYDKLIIYNKLSDINNCFLMKKYTKFNELKFNNNIIIVTIDDEICKLMKLPSVLLVNLCVLENFPIPRLNLSTGAIAAYIRKYHYAKVTIIDMQTRVSIEDIYNNCISMNPDIIGLSISFGQRKIADNLLNELNRYKAENQIQSLIIVGNVIPSLYINEFLSQHKEIIVCYQEGENSFLDLIDYRNGFLPISKVRGVAYVNDRGKIVKNPGKLEDISELPFPALDTVEDIIKYKGALTLELSRGCNYAKCSFCPREHKSSCWRCLSTERTIEYFRIMSDIADKNNIYSHIFLADEEFIGQLPESMEIVRINKICSEIKTFSNKIYFDISARIDSIYDPSKSDDDNINKLNMWSLCKENGLKRLFLGVESGCDEQLRRLVKGTTATQNVIALRLITALGISIRIGYITFDPLMSVYSDLLENISFLERTDILMKNISMSTIDIKELYYKILNDNNFVKSNIANVALYSKVSYMLTSLEVLANSKYSKMMEIEEMRLNKKLLLDIDVNMARYRVDFVNKGIGLLSEYCQRWIDNNFSLMYTIKSLYKVAKSKEKSLLYGYMIEYRRISHFLLKYMLYSMNVCECDILLYNFLHEYGKGAAKLYGDTYYIVKNSLQMFRSFMGVLVNKISNDIENGSITDTFDNILTESIERWRENAENWYLIN